MIIKGRSHYGLICINCYYQLIVNTDYHFARVRETVHTTHEFHATIYGK